MPPHPLLYFLTQPPPRSWGWHSFSWIFTNAWFWILLIVFVGPYVLVLLSRRRANNRFIEAREFELSNPLDSIARFQLGRFFLDRGRFRRAHPYLLEAHNIQKERKDFDPRLLEALAAAELHLGNPTRSIELLDDALAIDETGGQDETFLLLGIAHQRLAHPEDAIEYYKQASLANASLAEPVFRLAVLHHKGGKSDEARRLLDEFLKDAHRLPPYIRRKNRRWVWYMRTFPLSQSFAK